MSNLANKKIAAEKNSDKDRKLINKVINKALYGKTIRKLKKYNRFKAFMKAKILFKKFIKTKLYVPKNIWQEFGRSS